MFDQCVSDRMMGSTSGLLVLAVLGFLAWVSEAKDESKMTMPGARPAYADSYLCTAFSTKSLLKTNQAGVTYVTRFRPEADAKVRHFPLICLFQISRFFIASNFVIS